MADAFEYPAARVADQVDDYFGTAVADPYRWMEELDSAEVKQWVEAENALTQQFLAEVPRRAAIHTRLMELVNYERFRAPLREGGRLFYTHNSGLQNQAVLYWQEGEGGERHVLLDPNGLAADDTVSLEDYAPSEDGTLLAYALAEAGSDVRKIRVRVVETDEDLADTVEWVKFSTIVWARDGSGFHYSSFGPPASDAERAETLKRVASFHKLYFHRLGTLQAEDSVVYERPDDPEMLVLGGATRDGRYLVLRAGKGHTNTLVLQDLASPDAGIIQIAPVADAFYSRIGNIGERLWLMTNKDAPRGRVVEIDLSQPESAADQARWKTVVPESEYSLESVELVNRLLVLSYLVDAKSRVEARTLDGEFLREVALPGIGMARMGESKPEDTDLFYVFTNYTTPATIYRLDLTTFESTVWKPLTLRFDPAAYATRQIFATSKDGTRVPLFVTARKGIALDGANPALLYGYGGFSVSLGPAYSSGRMAWLELGGIYAEAILRGGGEYGETWHDAGTKTRKQNVFDDFIACAELLIAEGYTSPAKLAINGGSNGGLLVAAVAQQRPELFGAAVPQVGVLDMLRFDRFTIGYAWKPEYGSPSENEDEFRALYRYSPLHNVRRGLRYPPMLVTTADHDDRVFPAHSFKFTAAMQAAAGPDSAPVLIRIETRAGHGAGMPLSKQMEGTADIYGFLAKALAIA
jgi:prolyl oligopeptidase